MSTHTIVDATLNWIEQVVVGLNFCPFAKKVLINEQIDIQVNDADTLPQALEVLLSKLQQMDDDQAIETSLLVYPEGFESFDLYLDLYDSAAYMIEKGGYSGIYQLASFHPEYLFEGEDEEDPSHFTNRSPFPMLHILREQSMARILEQYPNPERIPVNNLAKAQALGNAWFAELLGRLKPEP